MPPAQWIQMCLSHHQAKSIIFRVAASVWKLRHNWQPHVLWSVMWVTIYWYNTMDECISSSHINSCWSLIMCFDVCVALEVKFIMFRVCSIPLNTWRNNNVVITSKRRHFDVITSKWRRCDVITTSLSRDVFAGMWQNPIADVGYHSVVVLLRAPTMLIKYARTAYIMLWPNTVDWMYSANACLLALLRHRGILWCFYTEMCTQFCFAFVSFLGDINRLYWTCAMYSLFTHILQGCYTGTGAIVWLPQCQWRNYEEYGSMKLTSSNLQHNAKQRELHMCMILGMYCMLTKFSKDRYEIKKNHK